MTATLDLEELARILYCHVKVTTTIKRGQEFESEFESIPEEEFEAKAGQAPLVYAGYLKAVDPITKSTILCFVQDNKVTRNILILGHNIERIELLETDGTTIPAADVQRIIEEDALEKTTNHPDFKQQELQSPLSDDELAQRREEILVWLAKNRIPAKVDPSTNEIVVAESVRIKSPYEHATDYICPTRVILKRVRHIVGTRV